MAVRAVKDKLKTSKSLPQVLSSCTLCNLVLGTEIGTRYRYIDDTPLVPLSEAAAGGGSSVAANGTKTRNRPNSEYVLYSYGEPVGMTNDSGTSYFGTDILGSVRSVTDKYGAEQSSYDYDAFGSPYLGNLENGIGFGYCGKVYDIGTGLYDYGFRDYSPVSARFTTVDPIRDGSNWFSYVVNDPVNYVDLLGLESTLKTKILDFYENSPGEIVNKTNYYLFPRADKNNKTTELLNEQFEIKSGETLTRALSRNGMTTELPLDGLVLPDGSIYKDWSGSKITVTQKSDGSFRVTQSVGTFIMNTLGNLEKAFKNEIIIITGSTEAKEEYYGYYSVKNIKKMEDKQEKMGDDGSSSITAWRRKGNVPDDYFSQKDKNTNINVFNNKGCTK